MGKTVISQLKKKNFIHEKGKILIVSSYCKLAVALQTMLPVLSSECYEEKPKTVLQWNLDPEPSKTKQMIRLFICRGL